MARFPFPFPQPHRPRRRYPRRVGLIGAIALLIAAVAGGMQQCQAPASQRPPASDQRPATSSQRPAASSQTPAPGDQPPAQWQTLDGPPITERSEVVGIWDTLRRIAKGPPYPYRQDGESFSNREGRLPKRERGWWHEYTVETPGSPDRGARRLVVGKDGETWYTADHYRTFVRLIVP